MVNAAGLEYLSKLIVNSFVVNFLLFEEEQLVHAFMQEIATLLVAFHLTHVVVDLVLPLVVKQVCCVRGSFVKKDWAS